MKISGDVSVNGVVYPAVMFTDMKNAATTRIKMRKGKPNGRVFTNESLYLESEPDVFKSFLDGNTVG
jgi:hypothetical protein